MITQFLQFIVSGLVIGCIYALVAIGFTVIYNATPVVDGSGLYAVAIGGGSARRLGLSATHFKISPDSTHVVWHSAYQLWSVSLAGGAPVLLRNWALVDFEAFKISSDSAQVVFDAGAFYSVPIAGGQAVMGRGENPAEKTSGLCFSH